MSNEAVLQFRRIKYSSIKKKAVKTKTVVSMSPPLMFEVMLLTLIYSIRAYCLFKQHSFTYMLPTQIRSRIVLLLFRVITVQRWWTPGLIENQFQSSDLDQVECKN